MAVACGVCVANICYNQPLLGDFAADFQASPTQVGWVAMASQVGYGLGLLFFLPLGDLVERRRIVLTLVSASTAVLGAIACSPSLGWLILFNLLIGATSMGAQILIPLAVELSPPAERGRTVGLMMAGLLGGILLARTLAGFVADAFGWRTLYGLAAGLMLVTGLLLRRGLPHRPPVVVLSYPRLMRSLWDVLKSQPRLWRPMVVSGLSFATFTVFWSTLAFLMISEFHRGASETGLFGLVGLAGALAAPAAGRLADRRGVPFTVSLALLLIMAAFLLMWSSVTIATLIVGVLLMDLGVQAVQVAEQGQVLSLLPEARSRLNTLYMVARFAGGAFGSLVGTTAWSHGHWPAVCAAALTLGTAALLVHALGHRFEQALARPAFVADPAV